MIKLKESATILGTEFDSGQRFTSYVTKVVKDAAWKMKCIRRTTHLLNALEVVTF